MDKVDKEIMKDFAQHKGWRCMEQWIDERKADICGRLLIEKDYEIIKQLQTEHEVYQSILNKVKSLLK